MLCRLRLERKDRSVLRTARLLLIAAPTFLALTLTAAQGASLTDIGNVLLARGRTEPIVAINPHHPSIVVVGSNTNYSAPVANTYPTGYFYSTNGGRSFSGGSLPLVFPYTTGADPTVRIDGNGTVFFSYLGETPSYCSGGRSAVVLVHSIDGGRSWHAPRLVDSNPSDDKPSLAVESIPRQPSHLFLSWTRWYHNRSEIWLARSLDGGQTFGTARLLYSSALNNFGSVPVVGPGGRVYVFWASFANVSLTAAARTTLMMSVSTNDGASFAPARAIIGPYWSVPAMAQPGSLRNLPAPAAAVAPNGAVYLAWARVSHTYGGGIVTSNIVVSRSLTHGSSWSPAHAVNDVARGDRFMPAMTVMPDGSLGLIYYDRRAGPANLDVYAAHASFRHGFHVSANLRVNHGTGPISDITYYAPGSTCFTPGRFFGDYIGAAAIDSRTMGVVWADTQLHTAQETDLWFARVPLAGLLASPMPAHR